MPAASLDARESAFRLGFYTHLVMNLRGLAARRLEGLSVPIYDGLNANDELLSSGLVTMLFSLRSRWCLLGHRRL